MKAIIATQPGGPQVLAHTERPLPQLLAGQVLVQVAATALNRADLLQRAGKYPPPKGETDILGLEFSGSIVALGDGVTRWQIGDRVCGLLAGAGYAEFVAVDAGHLLLMPDDMSFETAAAIPEAYLTAFQGLFWLGDLQPGHYVLIHAASGGVGSAATQLAKAAGATVIATASAAKHAFCRQMGADIVLDYEVGPTILAQQISEATDGRGVQVVLDFFAATYLDLNLKVLGTDGTLVTLALMGGTTTPQPLNVAPILSKRLTIKGSTLRNRDNLYKTRLVQAFEQRFWPDIHPAIDCVFDWHNVQQAHIRMENRAHTGKIVLKIH